MGDSVMVQITGVAPGVYAWLHGVVIEQKGPVSYVVQMKSGRVWRRHVEQLNNGAFLYQPETEVCIGDSLVVREESSTKPSSGLIEIKFHYHHHHHVMCHLQEVFLVFIVEL